MHILKDIRPIVTLLLCAATLTNVATADTDLSGQSLSHQAACAGLAKTPLDYDQVDALYSTMAEAKNQTSLFSQPLAHCLASLPAVMLAEAAELDLDAEGQSGTTPLQVALDNDDIELATALLAAGADPNKVTVYKRNALFYAKSAAAVKLLTRYNVELDQQDSYGGTALIAAVRAPTWHGEYCGYRNRKPQRQAATLKALCQAGANPDIGVDHCNDNAWTRAARGGEQSMQHLVEYCPLPNPKRIGLRNTFERAIHYQGGDKGIAVLAKALAGSSQFKSRTSDEQYLTRELATGCLSHVPPPTPLTATDSERVQNCDDDFTLDISPALFEPDHYGISPIQYAVRAGATKAVEALGQTLTPADIPAGFSLTLMDLQAFAAPPRYKLLTKLGNIPVKQDVLNQLIGLAESSYGAEWMLQKGADPNHVGLDKRTPLTSITDNQSVTEKLLAAGADPNLALCDCWAYGSEMNGLTPLLATIKQSNDTSVMSQLFKAGARPNQANRNGTTPAAAAATKFYSTLRTLHRYGVDFNLGSIYGRKPLSVAIRQYLGKYSSSQEEQLNKMLAEQEIAPEGQVQPVRVNAHLIEANGRSLLNNLIAEKFSLQRITLLVNNGAKVDARTKQLARKHPQSKQLMALLK